jgi:predicted HTH transcriptional regulator
LESRILALIAESPSISSRKIAEAMNMSRDTVKEYLARLKSKGLLTRVGPRRGGFWKIESDKDDSPKK